MIVEVVLLVKVMLSSTEHVVSFGELRENGQQIQTSKDREEEL